MTLNSIEQPLPPEPTARSSSFISKATTAPAFCLPKSTNGRPPAKAPKVAIPRLPQKGDSAAGSGSKSGGRHRVMHACVPCRSRKTKCSGEKPACKHCQDFKVICVYADGKRDRAKKAFGSLAEKVADYEAVLKDLSTRVGEEDANLIKALLEKDVVPGSEDSPGFLDTTLEPDGVSQFSGEESEASAGVGSTGAVDRIEEDFNRCEESRTTGFMGKNSEVTWLQKLRQENKFGNATQPDSEEEFKKKTGGFTVNESSYHLDDFSIYISEAIDRYDIPPRETADLLFNAYLESVHPSFPIIGKITFSSQYRKFMEGPSASPGERWLAILNMIFAIGARYSHLIQAEWRGDERDHLVYFSRARLLSLNGNTMFNHPDLQQVQVSGLIAFYLMATSQINRAWTIGGIAVRAAIALGINMRNDSVRTPDTSKEIRYRVWWSLYTLEHQLSMMTGRPASTADEACTTPLPVPLEEDGFQSPHAVHLLGAEMQKNARYPGPLYRSPNNSGSVSSSSVRSRSASKPTSESRSPLIPQHIDFEWAKNVTPCHSLYFLLYIQLNKLAQSVLQRLYTPAAIQTSWSQIQSLISELDQKLADWHSNLPIIFDFKRKQRDHNFVQQRMCLGFFYYGTRIIIHRPCLCRLDRKLPSQSAKSKDFNRTSAASCVDSAREMLQMLPDEPNAVGLNRIGPWWCLVHCLMQATVVVLLELSLRAHHMPEEAENIFEAAKKAVRWQHSLGEESYSARRAWNLCNKMLREAAPKIGREVENLPEHAPGPLSEPPHSNPRTSSSGLSPRMNAPTFLQAALHSGENFSVPQQDLVNITVCTGYDEYASYSSGEEQLPFFPTSAELDFMTDAYHDPLQPNDYTDQQYGGG